MSWTLRHCFFQVRLDPATYFDGKQLPWTLVDYVAQTAKESEIAGLTEMLILHEVFCSPCFFGFILASGQVLQGGSNEEISLGAKGLDPFLPDP